MWKKIRPRRRAAFLRALAETGNVTLAAEQCQAFAIVGAEVARARSGLRRLVQGGPSTGSGEARLRRGAGGGEEVALSGRRGAGREGHERPARADRPGA